MIKPYTISIRFVFLLLISLVIFSCSNPEEDLKKAKSVNSIQAYQEFIDKHPGSEHAQLALDKIISLEWSRAKESGSIEEISKYIEKRPTSIFLPEAKQLAKDIQNQIIEKEWLVLREEPSLRLLTEFLASFPDSEFSTEAKALKWELTPGISGLITAVNGDPLEGVTVKVKGTDIETESDLNGKYLLEDVDGTVVLEYDLEGHQKLISEEISLSKEDRIKDKNFRLPMLMSKKGLFSLNSTTLELQEFNQECEIVFLGFKDRKSAGIGTGHNLKLLKMKDCKKYTFETKDPKRYVTVIDNTPFSDRGTFFKLGGVSPYKNMFIPNLIAEDVWNLGTGKTSYQKSTDIEIELGARLTDDKYDLKQYLLEPGLYVYAARCNGKNGRFRLCTYAETAYFVEVKLSES